MILPGVQKGRGKVPQFPRGCDMVGRRYPVGCIGQGFTGDLVCNWFTVFLKRIWARGASGYIMGLVIEAVVNYLFVQYDLTAYPLQVLFMSSIFLCQPVDSVDLLPPAKNFPLNGASN